MAWQNRLDRLVLREVEFASGGGGDRRTEAAALLQDYLRLNPARPESFFALGFASAAAGVQLDAYPVEELEERAALWYEFGSTLAAMRKRPQPTEDGAPPPAPDYTRLLQDPDIARELLPVLLKQTMARGDLEESVQTLEAVLSSGAPDEDTASLLRTTLSEILRRAERPRDRLETSSVLGLLQRCMGLPGFDGLPAEIRAPFHRTLGKLEQHAENYEAAAGHFRKALDVAGEGHTLASVLHFDLAACLLAIRGVPDLEPTADRGDVSQALVHLDEATADAKRASFNAYFARGVLRFEREQYAEAAQDFQAALERIEMYRNPLPVTLARIRYFLGLSMLRSGRPEDREEAVRQLEKALERVRPDMKSVNELVPLLADTQRRVAVRVLSRMDVAHADRPEDVLAIGKYYQMLGDAENALKVAETALEKIEDLELRKEALLLELRAFNMLGERENAEDALYDLRDLCYQSGDLALWEEVIFDPNRVGQAMDRARVLAEQIELLARLGGRDQERFALVRELASSYLERAEPHWKAVGVHALKEAYRRNPDEFERDLKEAESRLGRELRSYDRSVAEQARQALGRTPSVLVLGGDEHQDCREDDLDSLASEWKVEAEWWRTDYVNPDRVLERLKEHLTARQPDGLLILHWNRSDLVRDVRKLCRSYRVPTRFCYYVGGDSLRRGVGELLEAATQQFADQDESNAAGA